MHFPLPVAESGASRPGAHVRPSSPAHRILMAQRAPPRCPSASPASISPGLYLILQPQLCRWGAGAIGDDSRACCVGFQFQDSAHNFWIGEPVYGRLCAHWYFRAGPAAPRGLSGRPVPVGFLGAHVSRVYLSARSRGHKGGTLELAGKEPCPGSPGWERRPARGEQRERPACPKTRIAERGHGNASPLESGARGRLLTHFLNSPMNSKAVKQTGQK